MCTLIIIVILFYHQWDSLMDNTALLHLFIILPLEQLYLITTVLMCDHHPSVVAAVVWAIFKRSQSLHFHIATLTTAPSRGLILETLDIVCTTSSLIVVTPTNSQASANACLVAIHLISVVVVCSNRTLILQVITYTWR